MQHFCNVHSIQTSGTEDPLNSSYMFFPDSSCNYLMTSIDQSWLPDHDSVSITNYRKQLCMPYNCRSSSQERSADLISVIVWMYIKEDAYDMWWMCRKFWKMKKINLEVLAYKHKEISIIYINECSRLKNWDLKIHQNEGN